MPKLVNMDTWRHRHDAEEEGATSPPNPERLQALVGMLLDAVSSVPSAAVQAREIRIRNFRSSRFELTEDLIVFLEEVGDGHYVANAYDTGQYGYGNSPDDALQGLCATLEEYHDLLLEDEGRLSPPLEAHLRYIRSILRQRA